MSPRAGSAVNMFSATADNASLALDGKCVSLWHRLSAKPWHRWNCLGSGLDALEDLVEACTIKFSWLLKARLRRSPAVALLSSLGSTSGTGSPGRAALTGATRICVVSDLLAICEL